MLGVDEHDDVEPLWAAYDSEDKHTSDQDASTLLLINICSHLTYNKLTPKLSMYFK